MRSLLAGFPVLCVLLGIAAAPIAAQLPAALPLQEGVPLDGPVFAGGLNFPVGLALLPEGSLLVGTSNPTGGSYFSSTGELVRLTDGDGDGVADGDPRVVASGLAGAVTAVAVANDLVFVTSVAPGDERIQILRGGGDWLGPYELLGEIVFSFQGFGHQSYGLATRPSATDPAAIELYFNIGARGNDTAGGSVPTGGLLDTRLPDASLYMTVVTDDGVAVSLSEPVQIASGLRNAMAFGFHPETGDLWITDNGIDGFEDVWTSYSADELNVIPTGQIGGDVDHFGFPTTYTLYDTGEVVGTDGILPVVAFVPIDGAENEGVASMAFTPPGFAPYFGSGVLVGFHGQYDQSGPENEENSLLFVDLTTHAVSLIVPPAAEGVGHLDSMVASDVAVYIADMCAGASLANALPCGTIYRLAPPD
jgi:glucose/arabinose dehydrogenase